MIATRLPGSFACAAIVSLVVTTAARAQEASEVSSPDVNVVAANETSAVPVDIVEATWTARREYHRQLRSTDLSELSSGAASIGLGAYALSRDAPFTRGLGGANVAAGGIHLISGILYTIRSQRGMSPERAPEEFREGDPYTRELEHMEHRADLWIAILTSDASIVTAGLTTALAGHAREKPVVQGVGIGLASQGVLTLLLDLVHQDQGRRYLRTLRDLNPQLTVSRTHAGTTVFAGVAFVR